MDKMTAFAKRIRIVVEEHIDGFHGVVVSKVDGSRFVDPRSFKTDSAAALATRAATFVRFVAENPG